MADAKAWFATLGLHCAVFCGTCMLFGLLRRSAAFESFYGARRLSASDKPKADELPRGFFAWWLPLLRYSDSDVAEIAGFDALTFVRLNWFGVELFGVVAMVTVLFIMPANYLGGAIDKSDFIDPSTIPPPPIMAPPPPPPLPLPPSDPDVQCRYIPMKPNATNFGNLDLITMSNVPSGSRILYVHLFVCVFLVFYTLRLVWRYNMKCVAARLAYLSTVEPGAEANTVLVQDIPGLRTGSMLDVLFRVIAYFVCKHRHKRRSFSFPYSVLVDSKLVQGPLKCVTIKKINTAVENAIAKNFGVGSGLKVPRTAAARARICHSSADLHQLAEDSGASSSASHGFLTPMQTDKSPGGILRRRDLGGQDPSELVLLLPDDESSAARDRPETRSTAVDPRQTEDSSIVFNHTKDLASAEKQMRAWSQASAYLQNHSVEELVFHYFRKIYGDDVACVNVVPNQQGLFPLIDAYDSTAQLLKSLLIRYDRALEKGAKPSIKTVRVFGPMYGTWGMERFGSRTVKVESLAFYIARLDDLNRQIKLRQCDADLSSEPAAFVTFRSRKCQTIASSALQDHDTGAWTVSPAPGPQEIIWSNIGMRSWLRRLRSVVVDVAYVSLALFYGIPVATIQAWLGAQILPRVPRVLQAFLPGVVLKIFLAALPMVLGFLAVVRGAQSRSRVQWEMVERYFTFQVIVVFIFQLFGQLAQSLYQLSEFIIHDPVIIFQLMGSYAPSQSWFFTSYVLFQGLSMRAFQLINPIALAIFWLKSSTATTEESRQRALDSIFFEYGSYMPSDTINILLGLAFAVQNPMMPLVVLIYFLTGSAIGRYNLMYVYSEEFQSGGAVWPTVVAQILAGVIVFEVLMVGMFSLFDAPASAVVMTFMIPVTVFYWATLVQTFNRPQRVMSMAAAAEMDEKGLAQSIDNTKLQQMYQPLVMRDNDARHGELMAHAIRLQRRVQQLPAFQRLRAMKEVPWMPSDYGYDRILS